MTALLEIEAADPRLRGYSVGRYYDPATGQFISIDPAVDETTQPYSYGAGDPVDNIDPTGLWCVGPICSHHFDPMASLDAAVNFGRGASFGLTDRIANWIVPGASCTIPQNSLDQLLGNAATSVLTAGGLTGIARWGALRSPYAIAEGLGARGITDALGNILIDSGETGQGFEETLLHEAFHRAFIRLVGTTVSQATYRTVVGRVVEEWAAEIFATGRPIEALRLALRYIH